MVRTKSELRNLIAGKQLTIDLMNDIIDSLMSEIVNNLGVGGTLNVIGNTLIGGVLSVGNATPRADWVNTYRVMQIGLGGGIFSGATASDIYVLDNMYYDTGWKFLTESNTRGSYYQQYNGIFSWYSTSVAGLTGVAAEPIKRMQLTQSGSLLIGDSITDRADSNVKAVLRSTGVAAVIVFETAATGSGPSQGAFMGYNDTAGLDLFNYENTGIRFSTNSLRRGGFSASGDFDIATNKFTVAGATGNTLAAGTLTNTGRPTTGTGNPLYITSTGLIWENTSSARFKENIQPLDFQTEKVLDLVVKRFNRINQTEIEYGVIAEEAKEVDPIFATYDEDSETPRGIQKDNVLFCMLEEIKKMRVDIDNLKEENNILKSRIETLENR